MKTNGEAIYGTKASPFEKLNWGRCSQKSLPNGKTRLYLHIFDWPNDGKLLLPLGTDATATARRHADGKELRITPGTTQTTILLVNPCFTTLQLLLNSTLTVHFKYLSSSLNRMYQHGGCEHTFETLYAYFSETHSSGWRSGKFLLTSNVSGSASRFFQT